MAKEPSVLEQIQELEAKKAALVDTAKASAMERVNAGIVELNALGFHYSLTEGEHKAVNRTPKDIECPICKFKTNPPHDKRSHKNHAAPFTAEELVEKQLTRV